MPFYSRCSCLSFSLPIFDAPASIRPFLSSPLADREWTEDGQLWVQYVSSTPATRLDVINVQEKLDQQLQQRQARAIMSLSFGGCNQQQ